MRRVHFMSLPSVMLCAALASCAMAATLYVSKEGSNAPPYDTVETAAHWIHHALAIASDGDTVFVLPGEYGGWKSIPAGVSLVGSGPDRTFINWFDSGPGTATSTLKEGSLLRGFNVLTSALWLDGTANAVQISECVLVGARLSLSVATSALVDHCTVAGYRLRISGAPVGERATLLDSILWVDEIELRHGATPAAIQNCDVRDPSYAGPWGNISADPLFVAWGDFDYATNPIYVRADWQGEEKGTGDEPFRAIGHATRSYSYHLGLGSPCIGAASDGTNMGAYPYQAATIAPGNQEVSVVVMEGTYSCERVGIHPGVKLVRGQGPTKPLLWQTELLGTQSLLLENLALFGDVGICLAEGMTVRDCDFVESSVRCPYRATIENCAFSDSPLTVQGDAVVRGCYFADYRHGAALAIDNASPYIGQCRFDGNYDAIFVGDCARAIIENCIIRHSVRAGLTLSGDEAYAELRGCEIKGSDSLPADSPHQQQYAILSEGGGIRGVVITGSRVHNLRTAFSSLGIKVTNSVVNNTAVAVEGGGVIEGATLVNNETAVLGPKSPEIRNSIIWSGGAAGASALVNVPPSNISHCLVPDPLLDGVNGNIFADPRFVDHEHDDFRLLPHSPCIDAGFNSPDLPGFDIAGMHRIMFGGKSLTVDMGAYEFYINRLDPVRGTNDAIFTWSSLADKTYSIFYTDDLFNWHAAIASFLSSGNTTTSWTDDGSLTGLPPLLAPKRFYRVLENP